MLPVELDQVAGLNQKSSAPRNTPEFLKKHPFYRPVLSSLSWRNFFFFLKLSLFVVVPQLCRRPSSLPWCLVSLPVYHSPGSLTSRLALRVLLERASVGFVERLALIREISS